MRLGFRVGPAWVSTRVGGGRSSSSSTRTKTRVVTQRDGRYDQLCEDVNAKLTREVTQGGALASSKKFQQAAIHFYRASAFVEVLHGHNAATGWVKLPGWWLAASFMRRCRS